MADLATRLPAAAGSHAVNVGLVFIFLGLAIKMALMPFHGWLPDAYTAAPDAVAPLLSALVTKVSLLAWVRIMYWVAGAGQDTELAAALRVCWMIGAVAAVVRRVSRPHPARRQAHVRLRGRVAHRPHPAGSGPGQPDGAGRIAVLPGQ